MTEDIQNGVERLAIRPDDEEHPKERKPIHEHWVYGFHFKHRVIHKIARKLGLSWESNPGGVLDSVDDHIEDTSGVPYWSTIIYRRERCSLVLTFAEDDGRKRPEKIKFSPQAMDRVRRAMMLPKGTKPKWYDTRGDKQEEGTELSSDDEEWPTNKTFTTTEDTIELMEQSEDSGSNTCSSFDMADEGIPRGALIGF